MRRWTPPPPRLRSTAQCPRRTPAPGKSSPARPLRSPRTATVVPAGAAGAGPGPVAAVADTTKYQAGQPGRRERRRHPPRGHRHLGRPGGRRVLLPRIRRVPAAALRSLPPPLVPPPTTARSTRTGVPMTPVQKQVRKSVTLSSRWRRAAAAAGRRRRGGAVRGDRRRSSARRAPPPPPSTSARTSCSARSVPRQHGRRVGHLRPLPEPAAPTGNFALLIGDPATDTTFAARAGPSTPPRGPRASRRSTGSTRTSRAEPRSARAPSRTSTSATRRRSSSSPPRATSTGTPGGTSSPSRSATASPRPRATPARTSQAVTTRSACPARPPTTASPDLRLLRPAPRPRTSRTATSSSTTTTPRRAAAADKVVSWVDLTDDAAAATKVARRSRASRNSRASSSSRGGRRRPTSASASARQTHAAQNPEVPVLTDADNVAPTVAGA